MNHAGKPSSEFLIKRNTIKRERKFICSSVFGFNNFTAMTLERYVPVQVCVYVCVCVRANVSLFETETSTVRHLNPKRQQQTIVLLDD